LPAKVVKLIGTGCRQNLVEPQLFVSLIEQYLATNIGDAFVITVRIPRSHQACVVIAASTRFPADDEPPESVRHQRHSPD
jgi:hypothetical protein